MTYLYVLWAVQDGLVKIGISKNRQKRQQTHSGNSSNPLEYQHWRLYKFNARQDAAMVESLAKKELTRRGFCYRHKSELFRCPPIQVTRVIETAAKRNCISVLKNYPDDTAHLFSMGLKFVDLPYYLLDSLTPQERKAYFLGASNAFNVFSFFDGYFSAREIFALACAAHQSEQSGRELWRCVLDTLAVVISRDDPRQLLIAQAREKIEGEQLEGFNQWQEIEVDACNEAA